MKIDLSPSQDKTADARNEKRGKGNAAKKP